MQNSTMNPNYDPQSEPTISQSEVSTVSDLNNTLELNQHPPHLKKSNTHCHVLNNENPAMSADKRRSASVWRKLITVLILCTMFMIGEIIGGIFAKSIAIQTDAAHMVNLIQYLLTYNIKGVV